MGTRADFYVGRGPKAEWLGSIAFDGYPSGIDRAVLLARGEAQYRAFLETFFKDKGDDVTRPERGWPWPWTDSQTTDYAYAFDEGRVWGTCFGRGWWPATEEPEEHDDWGAKVEFPDMTDRQNVTFGRRSGLIVLGGSE